MLDESDTSGVFSSHARANFQLKCVTYADDRNRVDPQGETRASGPLVRAVDVTPGTPQPGGLAT